MSTSLENRNILVFDFDGTLVDSLDTIVDKVNRVASALGRKPFSEEQVEQFVSSNSRSLLRRFSITRWFMSQVTKLIVREQGMNLAKLEVVPKLEAVLNTLKKNHVHMGIVTSNDRDLVQRYLKLQGWNQYFSFIYGGGELFQKNLLIQKMLQQQRLKPQEVIYVGDEPRDVEAAKAAGVRVAAVTWGFQPASAFTNTHPDWLITKPHQLLRLVRVRSWWQNLLPWSPAS